MIKEILQSRVSDIIKGVIFYMILGRVVAIFGSIAACGLVKIDEVLHSGALNLFSSDCFSDMVSKQVTSMSMKTSDSDYFDFSDEGRFIQSNPGYRRQECNYAAIETVTSQESPLSEDSNVPSFNVIAVVIDDCEIDRRRLVHSLLLRNCDVVPFAHFGEKASIFLARRHFDVLFVSANCLSTDSVGFSNLRELRAMTDALFVGIVNPGAYDKNYSVFDLQLIRPLNDSAITVVLDVECSMRQRILLSSDLYTTEKMHGGEEKKGIPNLPELTRTTSTSMTAESVLKGKQETSSSQGNQTINKPKIAKEKSSRATVERNASQKYGADKHKPSLLKMLFSCVCHE